ncbi:M14 family metallocarboxypeptidase [Metabacillus niabensis]|uniref:M14 family metallocarboxypeptidase n=1 Tax=Metabacillus niabensis TaxID=324854 RepID=UPI001CFC32DF|nr:M14 family metallocarboxypeptidase [Metabacillus niabensis]
MSKLVTKLATKLVVLFIIFSIFVSGIPIQEADAMELNQEEQTPVYIIVNGDVLIKDSEDNRLGTILKDAKIAGFKKGNDLFIDWFGNQVLIDQEDVKEVLPSPATTIIEGDLDDLVWTADSPLVVSTIEGEQLATLETGSTFFIQEELEEYFLSYLFNEEVIIHKESKETDLSNATEQIANTVVDDEGVDNKNVIIEEELEHTEEIAEQEQNEVTKEVLSQEEDVIEPKTSSSNVLFKKTDAYFKVVEENLPVYEKKNGELQLIASLKGKQVYERTRDYTSWHEVSLGGKVAYVPKQGTIPSQVSFSNNKVGSISSHKQFITFKVNTAVYDHYNSAKLNIASINKGVRLPVLKEYSEWYAVDLSGRIGYVQKKNVNAEFSPSHEYFEVTGDNVVGYKKVNGKLIEVTKLINGQVYPRIADYTSWHEVKFGNGTIFVNKKETRPASGDLLKNENNSFENSKYTVTISKDTYVYDNTSSSLVEFAELYKGTKYPIISDHGKWIKVDLSGRIGYIRKSDTEIEFSKGIEYFTSVKANVPVYDNSGKTLKVVGYLRSSEVYHRTKDYTSWHEIQYGNKRAFVAKDLTTPVLNKTYRNSSNKYGSVGSFKTKKLTAIYYYVGKKLVPFASISPNVEYSYVEDRGSYVKVNFGDRYGFVKKSQVSIKSATAKDLVNPRVVYSYNQMVKDIDEIVATYPDLATKKVIGKSVDGRNIYAVKLGKGSTEILINGSHHAREYLTTNIVMEMIDQYAQCYVKNSKIDGYAVRSILDKASIWFVPMVNPDGVTLVQQGHKSAKNSSQVLKINGGNTDFSAWKANVRGVDLNRQYPAGWNNIVSNPGKPAPQNYKGPKPLSEPESKAMYDFTNTRNFKTSVSYHSSGEILYWHFKQGAERTKRDREIAEMIKSKTGYALVTPKSNPSGGGFTDWFISSHLKPAFTPEISPYVGPRPVPIKSFDSIWTENKAIGIMLADEAYKNRNSR